MIENKELRDRVQQLDSCEAGARFVAQREQQSIKKEVEEWTWRSLRRMLKSIGDVYALIGGSWGELVMMVGCGERVWHKVTKVMITIHLRSVARWIILLLGDGYSIRYSNAALGPSLQKAHTSLKLPCSQPKLFTVDFSLWNVVVVVAIALHHFMGASRLNMTHSHTVFQHPREDFNIWLWTVSRSVAFTAMLPSRLNET